MQEIVFIAPYEELFHKVKKAIEKHDYKNVGVVLGDLRTGLEEARSAIEQGTSIIISRGGTYKLIKEEIDITTVELQISAYDIVKSIKSIMDEQKPVAIIGYDNIIHGYDLLLGAKGMNLHWIQIGTNETVLDKVRECIKNGIQIFLGDAIVNSVCRKLGCTCYMIESSEESVIYSIERAREILSAYKSEIERNRRYAVLMDAVRDGVLATDDNYRVSACNSVAEEILGVKKEDIIGRDINLLLNAKEIVWSIQNSDQVIDEIKKVNNTQVTLSSIPIIVNGENKGSVAVFQDVNKLQKMEINVRSKLHEKGFIAKYTFDSIVHAGRTMGMCMETAKRYSQYDSTVLIEGKSGVGKELFAQSIHNAGKRKSGPFVAVNCAALTKSLIESELFGYAEGAFTGSKRGGKEGLFELAHKGTIFLDEIGELPIEIQGRLLRVLQEREVMRVGDSRVIPLDIRIICATNRDLSVMVNEGTFREDLLYRINMLPIRIPSLNERREDIEPLAYNFLNIFNQKYGKNIACFTPMALDYLKNYPYKGNVRELRGMIERAVIIADHEKINSNDFTGIMNTPKAAADNIKNEEKEELFKEDLSLKELEDKYIELIYNRTGKSIAKTCEILKINRTTLWRKLS